MHRIAAAAASLALVFGVLLSAGGTASANALTGNGYSSSYAGESEFLGLGAGETGQFVARYFNDGSQTWSPGVVGLLVCLPDKVTCNVPSPNAAYDSGWYSSTVYATVGATTAPGGIGFFTYNISVPTGTAPSTAATFNGDVGLIATGTELRPEGYYQTNTTPPIAGTLTISPTSASMPVAGQQQFTATTNLTGTVTWSVSGGCGATTASGLFVATATNASSQPCSVVASIGNLTASAAITVFGAATQLACSASPSSVVAGSATNGATTLTITIEDANGNTVSNATQTITVTNTTTSLATLSESGALAATNGVLTVTVTSTSTPGTIVIAVASSSGITGCTTSITSGTAGTAVKTASSFTVSPIGADGQSQTLLRIDVEDVNGNRVTTDSGTIIDASVTSGPNVCTVVGVATGTSGSAGGGSGTATDVNGRVEFTVQSTSVPGTCVFTVTPRNTAIAGSTASLTTQIIGLPTQLKVISNDSPHTAGAGSLTTVKVGIYDAIGDLETNSVTAITAALDTTGTCTGAGGGSVVLASSGATTGGVATFTFTSNGAYTGCLVTFTSGSLGAATATIVFTPAGADHLGCVFTPTTIPADGSSVAVATVAVKDQAGNNIGAGSYSILFSYTHGDGVTTLVTSNPQTMTNGLVTFTVRASTAVGTDTYTPSLYTGSLPNVVANQPCTVQTH